MKTLFFLLLIFPAFAAEKDKVDDTILLWHKAASLHEEDAYFSLFSENAVFLGTDPEERWTKEEFRKWAHPIFAKGRGWSIQSKKRNIFLSKDQKTAWFDEDAESKELGPVRGSGVLVKERGKWKIAQYNLSLPILNDRFDEVRKLNVPKLVPEKKQ